VWAGPILLCRTALLIRRLQCFHALQPVSQCLTAQAQGQAFKRQVLRAFALGQLF